MSEVDSASPSRATRSSRERADAHVPSAADIEIVLVSYRSRRHVEELLASWPQDLRVVVVDNARGADGLREWTAGLPRVRYLDGGGEGFARGANRGAFSSAAPFVVFVNPDSRPSGEDLVRLVRGLADDPGAASHAATVTGPDGTVEIGVGGWEPGVARTLAFAVGLHKWFPRLGVYARPRLGRPLGVHWTTGACMAVRAEQFRHLGGFDESFFVYAEDMSFGRRARDAGLRQVLRHDVVVRHGAGGSGAPSREMLALRGASFANYVERYHPGARATLMRGAMVLGYLARAARERLRRDRDLSDRYVSMVRGLLSRRAFVAGREVARVRFEETRPVNAGRGPQQDGR